ncbi:SapC family protein [Gimibacter soli]|uniref:SapC family protein n=1 Tax=Gimibacter soli TaxID=3024400 RepID=A0AAE9XPP2_9PROT|nr:SapC family protein [Gimibacter soli]WCL54086.1 SapC family protein [Gimibacter soli]
MTINIVPLQATVHDKIKVKDPRSAVILDSQILPLVIQEIPAAAADMPVVFVKNGETGQFQAVALLGLESKENLFAGPDGWADVYVPRIVMNMPFKLVNLEDGTGRLVYGIDDASPLISEDGDALFENGQETDYLQMRKQGLQSYVEQDMITNSIIKLFVDLDLFVQKSLGVDVKGQRIQLDGIYLIDESKVNALAEDKFLDLRQRGILPVIYAHLFSLQQVRRLASLKAGRNAA